MSSLGAHDRAMALDTRWRMPPLSLVLIVREPAGAPGMRRRERPPARRSRRGRRAALVQPHDLAELGADRQPRVQATSSGPAAPWRSAAAHAPHLGGRLVEEVLTVEGHAAADDAQRRLGHEPHQRQARHRLAGAGFPDQGERLPAWSVKLTPSTARVTPARCRNTSAAPRPGAAPSATVEPELRRGAEEGHEVGPGRLRRKRIRSGSTTSTEGHARPQRVAAAPL